MVDLSIIMDSPKIPIPILLVIIVICVVILSYVLIAFNYLDLRKYGKEAFIFAKARKKNIPVLHVVDIGSNRAKFELGTKKKNGDIEYDNDLNGVQVDPSLTTGCASPTRYDRGLDIYTYSSIDWLPIVTSNALAYQTIQQWKQDRPDYDFIPFQDFVELISTKSTHLEKDVNSFIRSKKPTYTYQQDGKTYEAEYEIEDIVKLVTTAREEIQKLPIVPGFLTYSLAFESIPQAYSAQDVEQLKILIRKMIEQEWLRKINIMIYAIAGLLIMVGGAVAVFIISKSVGG